MAWLRWFGLVGLLLVGPVWAKPVLNLYIWSEYISPQILKDFEHKYQVRVQVSVYESAEEMLAKLQGGGTRQYDLIVPTDYLVPALIKLNLVQPLDKSLLPNLKNLDRQFANPPYDPGNTYTVPYQWGTMGIAYRKDKLKQFPRSWSLIFDPKQQRGPFVLIDDARPMLGVAALYLGYDMNTTDPTALQAIQKLMLATKQRSDGFIGGVGGRDKLIAGTATVAVAYNGDVIRAAAENPNLGYFIPQEGSNLWVDSLTIPAQAPNAKLAHAFINYILDPKVGAQLSNFNRFASPNAASLALLLPTDRKNPGIYPDAATRKKLFFTQVLKGETARLMDALWTNVKSY